MTAFSSFFAEEWDPGRSADFGLSSVTEIAAEREDLVDALATWVADNKTDPAVTADLLEAAGWAVAGAAVAPGRISVKRGDFGEVLAAEAIKAFDGLVIPISKLRYQIDPNQTLPGADIVGFDLDDDGDVNGLHFSESKYRTVPPKAIIVEAIEQLADDRQRQFATTIHFLANRLRETNLDLYERFVSYLKKRDDRTDSYSVCLTCDDEKLTNDLIDEVDDLPEVLQPMMLRVVPLHAAVDLIDAVCAKLTYDLDPADD